MKRRLFALGKGTPMVQSPILGIWCCEGDLLDAKRIWVAQGFKRGPRLWLGETLATNQSEASVRTATVTKMTAEVVP